MSMWTQSDYAVLGPEATVDRIYNALLLAREDRRLRKKIGLLNAFLVKVGYASQEDINKIMAYKEKLRTAKAFDEVKYEPTKLIRAFADFEGERIRYCNGQKAVLEFTTNVKYVFDECGNVLREMFPDVQVFGLYFDEAMLYDNAGDYRDITDDVKGVFFRKYHLWVVDEWNTPVQEFKSNDFNEFADEVEHLCGKRPKTDKEKELNEVFGLFAKKGLELRYQVLDRYSE